MKHCPKCGCPTMDDDEVMNCLSRRDNKTYICRNCGMDEALLDYKLNQMSSRQLRDLELQKDSKWLYSNNNL